MEERKANVLGPAQSEGEVCPESNPCLSHLLNQQNDAGSTASELPNYVSTYGQKPSAFGGVDYSRYNKNNPGLLDDGD